MVSDNWDQLHINILVHLEFPEERPALPIGISDRAKLASMLKAISHFERARLDHLPGRQRRWRQMVRNRPVECNKQGDGRFLDP
jgi:hypothetical protein